tara:strand:- start:6110 stop:6271 length:162 start_codon:yes stop_codon:yes gene_type:complete
MQLIKIGIYYVLFCCLYYSILFKNKFQQMLDNCLTNNNKGKERKGKGKENKLK